VGFKISAYRASDDFPRTPVQAYSAGSHQSANGK
jgi:hypothetical protein